MLAAVSLLTAMLFGCESTVSNIDSTSPPPTPYATIVLDGITTGGYLDVFDSGPVFDGGSIHEPELVILPGNPDRYSQFLTNDGGEYLYWHPSEPGSWIANAPAIVLPTTVDSYLSELATSMLTIPKVWEGLSEVVQKDWDSSSIPFQWYHFRDGECTPGPADTEAVRVTGTWYPTLMVRKDEDGTRDILISLVENDKKYLGSRQSARINYLNEPQHWLFFAPVPPPSFTPHYKKFPWSRGQMILDRDLSMAEKRLLADRWVGDNSFLFGHFSKIGQVAREPLVWYRPPGECQITVLLSLGFQPEYTVCVARSQVFRAEAGKEYRFSLRSAGGMKNYLQIYPDSRQ